MLADFMAEFTLVVGDAHRVYQVSVQPWKVDVDGASNARGSGVGIVLESPKGMRVEHSLRLGFQALNNEAEYEVLVARLRASVKVGATYVEIYLDSRLMVSQVKGSFEARDPRMAYYLNLVHSLQALNS